MVNSLKIVSGLILQDDKVLLCLRKDTQFFPGYWALPVGHVEPGENFIDALRRELFEEIGVQMIDGEDLTTLYDYQQNIQHAVFKVTEWRGQIENREPQVCSAVEWFALNQLPSPITPASETILQSLDGTD